MIGHYPVKGHDTPIKTGKVRVKYRTYWLEKISERPKVKQLPILNLCHLCSAAVASIAQMTAGNNQLSNI